MSAFEAKAQSYERAREDQPFWRFKRRASLARRAERARGRARDWQESQREFAEKRAHRTPP